MGGKGNNSSNGNDANMMMGMAAMQAANQQYQLGMEQLQWSKEVYNEFKPYILDSTKQQLADQKWSSETAREQYDFYKDTYKPIEADFADKVQNWDSPERREQMAGQAQSGVASQFEQARNAAQMQLESYGVDPTSTRYAALDLASRVQQGATAAGAGTQAIQNVEQTGLGLQGQAINTGRGYQQNVNSTIGTGSSAGNAGSSGLTGFFGTSSNAMTAPVAWFNAGNNAQSTAANAFNNFTKNSISQQQANTSQMTGMMSGISSLLGSVASLEDGGAIPEPGGHVPYSASPTQGAAVDDVPARLNAGEFVIPKEVVEWEGQKNIYKMIDKAKSEREHVEATTETKPQAMPALPGPPTFVSSPGPSAIPAR